MFQPAVMRFTALFVLSTGSVLLRSQNFGVPPELVGDWESTSVRSTTFQDRSTGAYAKPSGSATAYHIAADGQYKEEALIQSSMYNCTDTVFVSETGRVRLDASGLTLVSTGGRLTSRDNCNARFNYEKQLPPREYAFASWQVRNGQSGPELCLEKDHQVFCYHRKK